MNRGDEKLRVVIAARDELFGKSILKFVKNYRWPEKTEFHIIFVIEPNSWKNPMLLPKEAIEDLTEDELESAREVLEYMARHIYDAVPGVRVRRHLKHGDPCKEILGLSAALKANMIVLGSHTRTGVERMLLGSVASAVVAQAPCSTVVVRLSKADIEKELSFEFTLDDLPERMKEDVELCSESYR